MAKKLTLSAINKENSKLNGQKSIRILDEYEVRIHTKFRKTVIQKVMVQYASILEKLRSESQLTDETVLHAMSLFPALVIKEFSDVPIPSIDNIQDLIQVSNALLDTGILEQVYTHFPEDQLAILTDALQKTSSNMGPFFGQGTVTTTDEEQEKSNENI